MREITVAATQMACGPDADRNVEQAVALVRQAHAAGARLILLQELFETRYFCQEQHPRHFALAHEVASSPLLARLQALARSDEGWLLAMGYSTQRGYGRTHAFVGELRIGTVAVEMELPELGFAVEIGQIELTECETVNQFKGSKTEPPQFTRGYGLAFGHAERKAMAMALVDRALRAEELSEAATSPAQDEEFVLAHSDNVEASGFVQHLKLPHYVDFQSELVVVRALRAEVEARNQEAALSRAAE